MDLYVYPTIVLSILISTFAMYQILTVFENERIVRFLNGLKSPNVLKVLSDSDRTDIHKRISQYASLGIVFAITAACSFAINIAVVFTDSNVGPFGAIMFVLTNAWVIANWNVGRNPDKFIRACESNILAKVIAYKAAELKGKDVASTDDIVDWLDYANEELEKEMREAGEWPPESDDSDDEPPEK